jgi:hypothetical protein
MKGPTLCSTLIYYAATILLIFVITMNPLLKDGDIWPNMKDLKSDVHRVLETSFVSPFMRNLMLQALDDKHIHGAASFRGWDGSEHDKSACDCMRDFASPSIVKVHKNTQCDSKYQQDSCTVQNAMDFALDGKGSVTDGSEAQLQRMSLVADINSNDVRIRNRQDPMLNQFQQYVNSASLNVNANLTSQTNLKNFIDNYCSVAGYEDKYMPDIRDPDTVEVYLTEQRRRCPLP